MKLLDYCEIVNERPMYFDGQKKYIATGDVNENKIVSFTNVSFNEKPSRANLIIRKNDVIFAKMKNTNKVIFGDENNIDYIYSTGFYCLRCNKNLRPKFLYYYLNSNIFNEIKNNNCNGATMKAINDKGLKNIEVNFPNIEEQDNLINVLDSLYDAIKNRNDALNNYNCLIKSQFVEMFGDPVDNTLNWEVAQIGDICFVTKLAGFEYSKYINYKDSGDVIMIRGLNVKNNKLKLDDVYYIDNDVSDSLPRSQLHCGDICMTYVGINIGDVALVDDKNKYHLAPNVAKISLNDKEKTNQIFFVNLLAFNKSNFASTATNTAKQALNMERIRNLTVMMPPIELQNQFAQIVEQIDKQKSIIENDIINLNKLINNIL